MIYDRVTLELCVLLKVTREFLRTFHASGIKISRHGLTELIEGDNERQKWNCFLLTLCALLVQYSVCMRRMHFYLLESHLDLRLSARGCWVLFQIRFHSNNALFIYYFFPGALSDHSIYVDSVTTMDYVLLSGHWALQPPSYVWKPLILEWNPTEG